MPNTIQATRLGLIGVLALSLAFSTLGATSFPTSKAAQVIPEATCTPEPATTRFVVIGDYGNNSAEERAVAIMVKGWRPDFIITTGDNSYPDASKKHRLDDNVGKYYWEYIYPYTGKYKQKIGGPVATVSYNRFWPSPGNHDWYKSGRLNVYRAFFALPNNERYYTFTAGPVAFFAVDSDSNEPDGTSAGSKQANWLKDNLLASTAPWQVVYFHHAPYTSGAEHGPSPHMRWPFKAWGVDLVLNGHIHQYERLEVDGLPYIVNGAGGATLYEFSTPVPESQVRYNAEHGAQLVEASATGLRAYFYTTAGELIDTLTLGCAPGAWIGLTERLYLPAVFR